MKDLDRNDHIIVMLCIGGTILFTALSAGLIVATTLF